MSIFNILTMYDQIKLNNIYLFIFFNLFILSAFFIIWYIAKYYNNDCINEILPHQYIASNINNTSLSTSDQIDYMKEKIKNK